jgi:alkylation response protein AidB-like acyl-CoA dehydrogenase
MQQAVGEIDSALCASRILLASIAERVDRGDTPHPQESLYVKHNVTRNALDAASKAMELSGNPGLAQAPSLRPGRRRRARPLAKRNEQCNSTRTDATSPTRRAR